MKIAIQAADLDAKRIDGTRVYIWNILKNIGKLDTKSEFFIYHQKDFNPELTPPNFPNYTFKKIPSPIYWTQGRFAFELWKDHPEVLWMPMQTMPFIRRGGLKSIITIHDLAFKYFPKHFEQKDLLKLNLFSDYAIKNANKIIAVSESTKNDILKFYPEINAEKIQVIYHGIDQEIFSAPRNLEEEKATLVRFGVKKEYLLYVGAIQPRKNIKNLIRAFEKIKKEKVSDLQLVLAGGEAWLSQDTIKMAQKSPFAEDIKITRKLVFADVATFLRGAKIFILPSLYEGFGLPILEAFAAKVPVIAANNSSLPEVGGDGALYFDAQNFNELADKIKELLNSESLRSDLITKGTEQLKKFSWEKCAKETLEFLKS
jgi:glycosyltransferase involved in cell wall biosynthesis